MGKREDFILDVVSDIDADIVDKHLEKRFVLWQKKSKKNNKKWISIVALAACFCLIVSAMFVFLPDLFGTTGKQVPIYKGMTVSKEAPSTNTVMRGLGSDAVYMLSSPNVYKNGIVMLANENANQDANGGNIDVSGTGNYYAKPNEDIYIHVHIFNPDKFEILSFTLNGVKYSSYMFEEGSDLETLILKYNVGDVTGVQQYTIDAIKYIDGDMIKDVKMEGDKTIEVIVDTDNSVLNFNAKFVGWDLTIDPTWDSSFEGDKTILSLAVYEGETKIMDLDPADKVISGLRSDKRLFLVATYADGGETKTVKIYLTLQSNQRGCI